MRLFISGPLHSLAGGRAAAGSGRIGRAIGLTLPMILLAACWLAASSGAAAASQTQPVSTQWSEPVKIYETERAIYTPYLFADAFGATRLLWREGDRENALTSSGLESVNYMSYRDGVWSPGMDVIAGRFAVAPTGAVDPFGAVHLVWAGSGQTLNYATAPGDLAGSAASWSSPLTLDSSGLSGQLVAGSDGILRLAYPGPEASGVYFARYDSRADSWGAPVFVAETSGPDSAANYVRLAIGPDGGLHIVWTELRLPEAWPPLGVYYTRSADNGATWSAPIQLAGESFVQINVAVGPDGSVHTAWNGMVGNPGGRYHRWSQDGGRTWSTTVAVVPAGTGGTEGPPQLQIDNAGTVHLLTTFDGCAQYASWSRGRWSEPLCISGPEAIASRYIEEPALTLSNGNQLHAVFWDNRARLWHTTRMTGAPPTFDVLPTPEAPPTVSAPVIAATPTATPALTPTPDLSVIAAAAPPASTSGPGKILNVAALSAALVILVGALVRRVLMSRGLHEHS